MKSVHLHLTNVTGLGASQLMASLLPELENQKIAKIQKIHLPSTGILAKYVSNSETTIVESYKRRLPNKISRLLECLLSSQSLSKMEPIVVFGDLPLAYNGAQVLFVQQAHLFPSLDLEGLPKWSCYSVSRWVFRKNLKYVQSFIVQSENMRRALENDYPESFGRVHVLPMPVPDWLLNNPIKRTSRVNCVNQNIKIFYPAAPYPHKNHRLLAGLVDHKALPIDECIITLTDSDNPAPQIAWLKCSGLMSASDMIKVYSTVDAIIFLSLKESYGFPLVEAMVIGLPILCPDLPYARHLCGEQAIYFNATDPRTLSLAIYELTSRLRRGWWPNWHDRIKHLPETWAQVANKIINVALKIKVENS